MAKVLTNGRQKLTDVQVSKLKEYAAANMSRKNLARTFKVSEQLVSMILSGKRR